MAEKKKIKRGKKNTFHEAVLATPDIKQCFLPGLQAFGKHSIKIQLGLPADGSVNIDTCTKGKYGNDSRWDYVVGYKGFAYFIEVHSANTAEVSPMFRKLDWLKQWLNSHAPELNKIKEPDQPFIWVQSSGMSIPKHTSQYRRLVSNKLLPVPVFRLS